MTPRLGKFFELDQLEVEQFFAHLGKQLFNSLPISLHCGHSHPIGTIADYYRVASDESRASSFAAEFLVDFMCSARAGTGQLLFEKWLGEKEITSVFNRVLLDGIREGKSK